MSNQSSIETTPLEEIDPTIIEALQVFDFNGVSFKAYSFKVVSSADGFFEGVLQDGTKAVLPSSEVPPHVRLSEGSVIQTTMLVKGDLPVMSASRPELVAALYAGISPEVRTGAVRIINIARIPGVRSKVAVAATVSGVDPVAALVGREANRVSYVSKLLAGERIDVVPFSPDLVAFAKNAMAPAAVESVSVKDGKVFVHVLPHQMPAAVGNGGWNSHLVGELLNVPVEVKEVRS